MDRWSGAVLRGSLSSSKKQPFFDPSLPAYLRPFSFAWPPPGQPSSVVAVGFAAPVGVLPQREEVSLPPSLPPFISPDARGTSENQE